MKSLKFFIAFMFLSVLGFSQNASSSISVTEEEDSYKIKASFSDNITSEVFELLKDELGSEYAIVKKNAFKWERFNKGNLAYKFVVDEKTFSSRVEKEYLDKDEYEDLIDVSKEVHALLKESSSSSSSSSSKDCEGKKSQVSIVGSGDISLNLNGNPVNMEIDDDYFSLKGEYSGGEKEVIEKRISRTLGDKTIGENVWEKKENGETLYRFDVRKKKCQIFIDKTKMEKEEWEPLQNLAFAVAGKIF